MNIVSFFISHTQTPLIKQPIKGRLDNVAISAQSAAMVGVAFGDQRLDAACTQRLADFVFGVIRTIRECFVRASAWPATRLFDRRDRIDQSNGHFRIVHIRSGVLNGQWDAVGVNHQMALRAIFPAIRGVWARFRPPKSARTEQLSIAEVDQ